MAVTATAYGNEPTGQFGSTAARRVDWPSDTVKVALTTSTYTPDQDAHVFFSDVTNEVTGTGYTAGGATLAGKAIAYDSATNQTRMTASPTTWSGASFTARRAVVYKDTGTASTSPLLSWVDFGTDQVVSAGTLTITWDSTGVVRCDAA